MRGRIFLISFLCLQLLMSLLLALAVMSRRQGDFDLNFSAYDFWFWAILAAALLMPPLQGLNSIHSERTARTLELVKLTKLSPSRFVHGKWLVLAGEALLLVIAILPYLMLRYFLGRIETVQELSILSGLLSGSFFLSSLSLALSSLGWRGSLGFAVILLLTSPMWVSVFGAVAWLVPWVGPVLVLGIMTLILLQVASAFLETLSAQVTAELIKDEPW